MRIQETDFRDLEAEYYASVIGDNGEVLADRCSPYDPTYFLYNGNLYVVIGPFFDMTDDWTIYKLNKVLTQAE